MVSFIRELIADFLEELIELSDGGAVQKNFLGLKRNLVLKISGSHQT